jgi:hypothetical protein
VATVPDEIFEALIAVSAEPLPEIETDVIAPALNSPDVPRSTIVDAPLAVAAVVLALAMVPEAIFEALIAVRATPLPDTEVNVPVVPVITFPAKLPFASLATIVDAPLADAAVVRAFAIVPVDILEALIAVKAEPLPLWAPETDTNVPTFAAKLPLASLATIVLAPFADAAVVLALATVPVVTFDPLIADTLEPSPIKKAPVIAPALNSPDVPRSTMVLAPLAVAAVVRAFATVPVVTFEPLMALIAEPLAVIMFAVNEPFASRATMVDAPLASEAVVLALAIVPLEIFEALMAVKEEPFPEMFVKVPVVPVITLPANDPLASRTTRVEAPLAEVALVLALSKVPVVIAEALIAVIAEPLPEKEAPVIAPAANSPDAPRRTIVLAPLEEEAVVRAFAIVPVEMLEALIAVT